MVTFTEEILNEKLHILCSDDSQEILNFQYFLSLEILIKRICIKHSAETKQKKQQKKQKANFKEIPDHLNAACVYKKYFRVVER